MNPALADLIIRCWDINPSLRPTFAEIANSLEKGGADFFKSNANGPGPAHQQTAAGKQQSAASASLANMTIRGITDPKVAHVQIDR